MNILITGGSGFLGSKLALALASLGHDVSLILRSSSRLDRLGVFASEFVIGRTATNDDIQDFVSRVSPEIIIHTACSYGRGSESLIEVSDANYQFGLSVLQAALAAAGPVTFINTGTALDPKTNIYSVTKDNFAQVGHVLAMAPGSKLRFINILLQHMYGPADDKTKFTTHVIWSCKCNVAELNLTAGTQIRDFIYIDDVVSAYATIVDKSNTLGPSVALEVGSGDGVPVREFVETVHRLTGSSTQLNFGALPFRPHETMLARADISRMHALGWVPKFDLVAGIRQTLDLEKK